MTGECRRRTLSVGVALVMAWAATGCGSYLTEKQLAAANNVQFEGHGAAPSGGATPGSATPATVEAALAVTPAEGASAAPAPSAPASSSPTAAGSAARPASSSPSPGGASAARPASAAAPAAAKGSGASAPAGAGSATPAGTPAAAQPGTPVAAPRSGDGSPVKIAQLGTNSGPLGAAMQPAWDAARAWAADVNARGGLAGHPVQLITGDDRGDPTQAVSQARRLVEQEGVIAFFGLPAPTTGQTILSYLETKNVPALGSCICNTDVDKSPMMFEAGPGGSDGLAWEHLGGMVETTKIRKVAILYCREAATCSNLLALYKKWAGPAGVQIVYEGQMSIAQPDYTAEVIQAHNAGAEALITLADNATTIRVARSAHRQNWQPLIATQHAGDDDRFVKTGSAEVEGALVASATADWRTAPEMAGYRQAMDRYVTNGARGGMGSAVWAAGQLLEKAAQRFSPHPTAADVLEGLYGLHGETLGGIVPPLTYVRSRGHADTNTCHVPMVIKDGKVVPLLGPSHFSCTPGWKPVAG
jgi:branched-chain amino acid transport system substrate-binding protein